MLGPYEAAFAFTAGHAVTLWPVSGLRRRRARSNKMRLGRSQHSWHTAHIPRDGNLRDHSQAISFCGRLCSMRPIRDEGLNLLTSGSNTDRTVFPYAQRISTTAN